MAVMDELEVKNENSIQASIKLRLRECPLVKVSAHYPGLEYRIQDKQVLPGGGVLASLVVKQGSRTDPFFRSLNGCDAVRSLNFLYFGKDECKVRTDFDCTSCIFMRLMEDLRISSDYIYYKNCSTEAVFSLKDRREFRNLLMYFKEEGIDFEVLEVKRINGSPREDIDILAIANSANLTLKQKEILMHAYHSGYFDRDRKVNLGDIAEHFSLSPATVGVHMRVGLKKILKNMM